MDNILLFEDIDTSGDIKCTYVDDPTNCKSYLDLTEKGNPFSILCVNIRSINCNLDRFLVFLTRLDVIIDILVFTECWIHEDSHIPIINNYEAFSTKHTFNQNDGVIIYVRNIFQNIEVFEPSIEEGNCLIVNIDRQYTVIGTYRPPSFKNVSPYLDSIDCILRDIKTKNIVFTGDTNLDIMTNSPTCYTIDYLNIMASHGLRPGISVPTRDGTCLDHFMVKTGLRAQTLVFEHFTDHAPILLCLEASSMGKCDRSIYLTKTIMNFDKMEERLKSINWSEFYYLQSANDAAQYLITLLQKILTINTETKKNPNRNRPLKPWITTGVVRSIRKRDKIHKRLKNNINDEDLKNYYIQYRNICNKIIKTLKCNYYQSQLEKYAGNSKETWKTIKELCNLNKPKSKSMELLRIKENSTDSLNEVNKYFTSIGKILANETLNKLNKSEADLTREATNNNSPKNSMLLLPTDPVEVRCVILNLKNNSAAGHDQIPTRMLKIFHSILAEPISHLCNLSFSSGVFPEIFKKATVTPIYKAGDKTLACNYRPIALLSVMSKILEKIVNKRLIGYLESNELLSPNQFGFRTGKSTEDCILNVTSQVNKYVDEGDRCVGVFIDLQKAFDTVSTSILLRRLENLGIRGTALQWFQSYLCDRKQCVRVDGHSSNDMRCTYGVPQGSTLGPTLFLTYANDMTKIELNAGNITMYADDTVIIFHAKSWERVKQVAEAGLAKISCWLENNLLSLNTIKTKLICFSKTLAGQPNDKFKLKIHTSPCNKLDDVPISCNCPYITKTNTIKYLGIIIDEKLQWKHQIISLSKKIRKLVYVFKLLRLVASPKLLLQTYKTLCESLICYGICSWGGACKSILVEAERAQRCILKVMLLLPFRYPTTLVYEKARVLSVRKLFIYQCIRRYHRITAPCIKIAKKRTFKYPTPRTRSIFAKRHYSYIAPHLYNKLHREFKLNLKNYSNHQIKARIRVWLENLDYDSTEALMP